MIIHDVNCPGCGTDLKKPESIAVHFSADGQEFDRLSSVNDEGHLRDTEDGLISKGFHAGSHCCTCSEQLEELINDQAQAVAQDQEDWYVRWEGRSISGPMSKELALGLTKDRTGIIFSGNIFSSEHIASKLKYQLDVELDKVMPKVSRLIDHLLKFAKSGWSDSLNSADLAIPSSDDLELLHQAAEALLFTSAEKQVRLSVRGGVISDEVLPRGVHLIIDEYDVEGMDETELTEDADTGESYLRREFNVKYHDKSDKKEWPPYTVFEGPDDEDRNVPPEKESP